MEAELKPVNVLKGRDELGKERDFITAGADSFRTIEELEQEDEGTAPPPSAPVVSQSTGEGFRTIEELEEEESVAPTAPRQSSAVQGGDGFRTIEELEAGDEDFTGTLQFLPKGIESGSYSPDDLSTNDDLYSKVESFMLERYGLQSVEGKTKKQVVNQFLNNRRGVAMAGNSVRVLSETSYLKDVIASGDKDRLDAMAGGYALYEHMAGVTSDETSWWEALGATGDVLRSVLLDPVNLAGGIIGKAVGGTTTKAGIKGLDVFLKKEISKQVASGASKAAVKANSSAITRVAVAASKKEGTGAVAEFAAKMAATKGGKRILTRAGIAEVSTTALVDAVAGSGFEYLYQEQLVDSGVQDEINPYAVGLAALGSLAIGGVQAGKVASRGWSGTALVSEVVGPGSKSQVAKSMKDDILKHYGDLKEGSTSWASKVARGTELDVQDTDFFIELLLGQTDEAGNLSFRGLAHSMMEEGFYFIKRDENDLVTNHAADFIRGMSKRDVQEIVGAFESKLGIKLDGLKDVTDINGVTKTLDEITPESFAQALARKMSDNARGLNSASQLARKLGVDMKDLDVETFIQDALDFGIIPKGAKGTSWVPNVIKNFQNRFIRTLVSHPSTSLLNVMGWGVSSGLGSVNDLIRGTIQLGAGTIQKLAGGDGSKALRRADVLLSANANRIRFLLDPDMTAAAFHSALERNSGALDRLKNVQSGGVNTSSNFDELVDRGAIGGAAELFVKTSQTATFVDAQDIFTKSQEYMFQMDKATRTVFNQSYNDFINSAGANKKMATKQYQAMEKEVIEKVMEHTFSKTYKGTKVVGEIAGFIEDARNLPGIGMLVPFGRFFNNTVDFALKNTGGGLVMKALSGAYPNKSYGELFTSAAIAGGLIISVSQNEQEKRRQGLGMYDSIDPLTGEIFSQQYDYPLSLFIALGRWFSYSGEEDSAPPELLAQIAKDFGPGGLTRNLTTTGDLVTDAVAALAQGEFARASEKGGQAFGGIGSQAISGFTRPFEPGDTIVGLATGSEMRPQNVKDGNLYVGKSITYIRNTAQLFTGKKLDKVLVGSAEGERSAQLTKNVGVRVHQPTNTLRLMNLLAYDSWEYNAPYAASLYAAGAANEYNRMMHQELERTAEKLMADQIFRESSNTEQRAMWEEVVGKIKDSAMFRLSYEYSGPQSTFAKQIELTGSRSHDEIRDGMKELGFGEELGELSHAEIMGLESYLKSVKSLDTYNMKHRIDR